VASETFKFSTDPAAGTQDPGRGRPVSPSAGAGGCALRGREEPGAGAGPHRPNPAAAPGIRDKRIHDYVRHGATTLFAALEVATGPGRGRPMLVSGGFAWLGRR
jgi:hypothetical protein